MRRLIRRGGDDRRTRRAWLPLQEQAKTAMDVYRLRQRVLQVETELKSLQDEVSTAVARIASEERRRADAERAQLSEHPLHPAVADATRFSDLASMIESELELLRKDRERVLRLRQSRVQHALTLRQHQTRLEEEARAVQAQVIEKSLGELRKSHAALQQRLLIRRQKMLRQLFAIFPIKRATPQTAADLEVAPASASASAAAAAAARTVRIANIAVPPTVVQGEEEALSTAHGYAAHLVVMLAKYLDVPLRYRVRLRGSRSGIYNELHSMNE
jgi:predicted  nucleic acid-binding Zn-ribbon protein